MRNVVLEVITFPDKICKPLMVYQFDFIWIVFFLHSDATSYDKINY